MRKYVELARQVNFKSAAFEEAFAKTVSKCAVITHEEAEFFITNGFVLIKKAFSRDHALHVAEQAWLELENIHGVNRNDPSTWSCRQSGSGSPTGYARLKGSNKLHRLKSLAPRAFFAQADLVGGPERFPDDGEQLMWGEGVVSNLGIEDDLSWQPPAPQQPGWHKDGWHFRHFLNSPEQALVTVPLYTDIQERSGGTFLIVDSIAPVARMLRDSLAGLHPDSVQGAGYLIPGLVDCCETFTELTGEAGDMALLHPFMLHRVSINSSSRPRFIANMAPVLRKCMSFDREPNDSFSLVELATLHALGMDRCPFESKRGMQAYKPGPFRNVEERSMQNELLREEMQAFATQGIVTPAWAQDQGYMSNREFVQGS